MIRDKTLQPLSSHTGNAQVLAIVRQWLIECLRDHDCCNVKRSFVPTRLIDVSPEEYPLDVRLVNSQHLFESHDRDLGRVSHQNLHQEQSECPVYATLSHRWGQTSPSKTRKNNIEEHLRRIPIDSLDPAFTDAILVTRKLGVRYLWIDSICIIQDSGEDWEKESSHMGNVYMNGVVNIYASASENSSLPFLVARDPTLELAYYLPERGNCFYGIIGMMATSRHQAERNLGGFLSGRG